LGSGNAPERLGIGEAMEGREGAEERGKMKGGFVQF